MADPAFARVPVAGLLDKKYAAERRKDIDLEKPGKASPGTPSKYESGSTTSFSVRHLVISTVRGDFGKTSGSAVLDDQTTFGKGAL
jgi:gamma-glutamyltranspeptidase/glutathione hydrolase